MLRATSNSGTTFKRRNLGFIGRLCSTDRTRNRDFWRQLSGTYERPIEFESLPTNCDQLGLRVCEAVFIVGRQAMDTDARVAGELTDGLEAVLKAEELQPDLILLDIGLPKLDGIRAARHIRKVALESKIVFLTREIDPVLAHHGRG